MGLAITNYGTNWWVPQKVGEMFAWLRSVSLFYVCGYLCFMWVGICVYVCGYLCFMCVGICVLCVWVFVFMCVWVFVFYVCGYLYFCVCGCTLLLLFAGTRLWCECMEGQWRVRSWLAKTCQKLRFTIRNLQLRNLILCCRSFHFSFVQQITSVIRA